MQKYNKHIINPGDTLKSIANLYGLSEESLMFFHNNHCRNEDRILINITKQKEIFLPRTAVLDKNKLVKFVNGNRLIFKPENSFFNFGVSINIENGEKKNELKYETSVKWLKAEDNLHFFEIDRTSKVFINKEEINDIADTLAYKTSLSATNECR